MHIPPRFPGGYVEVGKSKFLSRDRKDGFYSFFVLSPAVVCSIVASTERWRTLPLLWFFSEAIASRFEAIASRLEAPLQVGWSPSQVGWRPLLLGSPFFFSLVIRILLGTSASLVVTSALLVVTRSYSVFSTSSFEVFSPLLELVRTVRGGSSVLCTADRTHQI